MFQKNDQQKLNSQKNLKNETHKIFYKMGLKNDPQK